MPATGFYEWQQLEGKRKQPWFIHSAQGGYLGCAGLWEHWRGGDQVVESCTVIVQDPDPVVAGVHDRMPVVLAPELYAEWLDSSLRDPDRVLALLQANPGVQLARHPVGVAVSNSRNEGPDLIAPPNHRFGTARDRRASDRCRTIMHHPSGIDMTKRRNEDCPAPPDDALVAAVVQRVRVRFEKDGSGHDWHHILRVRRLAEHLGRLEGADLRIVALGALLHDVADWKFHGGDDAAGPREAERLLREEGADERTIAALVDIVASVSFKGARVATPMWTIEGQVVQDADRLDAHGAIGIARCFAYGGHAGRPLYDPSAEEVLHDSAQAYKAAHSASLNHFHEKLYHLKDRMNTAAAGELAEERHRLMEEFEARFVAEWYGRDADVTG